MQPTGPTENACMSRPPSETRPYKPNGKIAKPYKLIAPDGTRYEGHNLRRFVLDHAHLFGLTYPEHMRALSRMAAGLGMLRPGGAITARTHLGWRWADIPDSYWLPANRMRRVQTEKLRWTALEDDRLKQLAPHHSAPKIAESMPGRTRHAVENRAKKLKIRLREDRRFTAEDLAMMRALAPDHTAKEVAAALGRKQESILNRAHKERLRLKLPESYRAGRPKGPKHKLSKPYDLIAPDGTHYQGRNLRHFVRENPQLFGLARAGTGDPGQAFVRSRISARLYALRPGNVRVRHSWHGWRWAGSPQSPPASDDMPIE